MDQSGAILQPACFGARLKNVKDLLQANTGVSFLGEKRSRPTSVQLLTQNKKPNGFVKGAGVSVDIACLTCLKRRDDDCKVCNVCCACCACVPRKEFTRRAHFYAAAPAEDRPVAPLAISLVAAAGESPGAPAEDQPVVPSAISLAAAAGESPSAPAADQPVVPLANSVGAAAVIESIAGGIAVTYADEEDYYDAPKPLEGNDRVRENHCVGCDCEFTTRQALDAHCCSEDEYHTTWAGTHNRLYQTFLFILC